MLDCKALILAGLIGLAVNSLIVLVPCFVTYKIQHKFITHDSQRKTFKQIIEHVLDDKSVFIRLMIQFIFSLILFYDLFI